VMAGRITRVASAAHNAQTNNTALRSAAEMPNWSTSAGNRAVKMPHRSPVIPNIAVNATRTGAAASAGTGIKAISSDCAVGSPVAGALFGWVRGPEIVTRRTGPETVAAVDGTDLGDAAAVVLALRLDAGDERMTRSGGVRQRS
jgi:hypothetical protein